VPGPGGSPRIEHRFVGQRRALLLAPFALLAVQAGLIAFGPPETVLRIALPATILAAVPLLAQFLHLWGIRLVLVGLAMNLSVILANGGLMPVTPATVVQLAGPERQAELTVGEPIAGSKDVLLEDDDVRLPGFRDRFIFRMQRLHAVYSPGDLVVLAGLAVVLVELALEVRRLPAGQAQERSQAPDTLGPGAAV